jgi:hypothetical protein
MDETEMAYLDMDLFFAELAKAPMENQEEFWQKFRDDEKTTRRDH